MNWDDMRVFLALARSGTLARAAALVEQDATTVARRIQRLEAALATTLFEHGATGQTLTESGHRLLAHAEAMEAGARAVAQQAESGAGLGGTIRISVSEGFGMGFMAPRLPGFTEAHPGIALDLIASTGFLNPSRREADIAIMLARPKGGPLIAAKLTDYRLGVYASADYLAATGPVESVEALTRRRLVGYVPDLIFAPELRYLAEVDERLEPAIRSSSISAQALLIAGGAGCGILPCFMGDRHPALVRLLAQEVAIERSFWLVVHRDMRRVARIEAFIGWLREEVSAAQPTLLGKAFKK
ncbi:LysR family transcriptional regulator [Sphingomonas oryzagri]|uniref:LysR family transcriptional regulator n=1 Tax=Sphingomonas oryzagri TaxID=3042314 RepID=A0ABT6N690_9SPHN|nr:LysR family transcriptional regulator [Sphingomonas oryzagri]MDH7640616.1 LysR family transcriptional regulator [Sphingomonas oryzagri]